MSEIKKTICDRCKTEIQEQSFKWVTKKQIQEKRIILRGHVKGEFYSRDYDLCTKCEEQFEEFMGVKNEENKTKRN